MTGEAARRAAQVFLSGEHGLTPEEADGALAVAEVVLDEGLARLRATAAAGDDRGCREAAHGLKGCLLNLGLDALAALARDLERATREGDAAGRDRLIRDLGQALAGFGSA